ncbi:MAG TPA: hypothetical protein VKX25_19205 [Bryobacteraceae bacterium]|nr:hypothetical protein [Bryobacteraceae bacterium]
MLQLGRSMNLQCSYRTWLGGGAGVTPGGSGKSSSEIFSSHCRVVIPFRPSAMTLGLKNKMKSSATCLSSGRSETKRSVASWIFFPTAFLWPSSSCSHILFFLQLGADLVIDRGVRLLAKTMANVARQFQQSKHTRRIRTASLKRAL